MAVVPYRRQAAAEYAQQWAFSRNPRYYNFDQVGGDCTNFISQCIYAGCGIMNYKRDVGWYYNSAHDRAAAWSGVPYLYNFLTRNKGAGPFASVVSLESMMTGDVIQLGNSEGLWYHSLLVVDIAADGPLVATHTYDAYQRPLYDYVYDNARFLHIEGAREAY